MIPLDVDGRGSAPANWVELEGPGTGNDWRTVSVHKL